MIGNIVKITNSSKNIGVTSTVVLVNVYKTDIIKIGNNVFIILLMFNNIFKFDYNIIRSRILRTR
jgi:hypothetical protein